MTAQNQTEEPVLGMWSAYSNLTTQDEDFFEEIVTNIFEINVIYKPIAVSTQAFLNAINYRFKCIKSVSNIPKSYEVIVQVYRPLMGKPIVTDIIRI